MNDANTSAKRRKLDNDPPIPSSGGRSTRSSQSLPRPDIYTIVDDAQPAPPELIRSDGIVAPSLGTLDNERIPETQSSGDVGDLGTQPTPSVHFADESVNILGDGTIVLESTILNPTEDTVSRLSEIEKDDDAQITELETPIPARKRKRGTEHGRRSTRRSTASVEDDIDELSPQQPAKATIPSKRARAAKQDMEDQDPLSDPVEAEIAEEVDDLEAARVLDKTKSKRKSIDPIPAAVQDEDTEEVVLPRPKRRRREIEESNRAEQRQPKRSAPNKSQTSKKRSSSKPKLRAGSPIPVVVHRLTGGLVYEGDDPDIDILNAEIPNVKRAGVNSIDVLRQICQEIFGSALETLQEGRTNVEDAALRREYATKWRAVNSFADEVYARLVEHVRSLILYLQWNLLTKFQTINLDNSIALASRLKAENRKKLELRAEILRVRAEREKLALRMDEVRQQHEKDSQAAIEQTALNNSIHDIELAIERGERTSSDNSDEPGTHFASVELKLKRVAELASNKGNGGGILAQIKQFNAFLERSALALEAKRV